MSLLREIQQGLMDGAELGPILMKLRFLASRFGSDQLEDWVKHEAEGYPNDVEVPDYRKVGVNYKGTFVDIAKQLNDVPVPNLAIVEHCGPQWTTYEVRSSVSSIEGTSKGASSGELQLSGTADLIPALQGKVYEGMACIDIKGKVARPAFEEIVNIVRNRVLELTIELEKALPGAKDIVIEKPISTSEKDQAIVNNVFHQTIHGDFAGVASAGDVSHVQVNVVKGDGNSLQQALTEAGIPEEDAAELAEIAASEPPESATEPFGTRAKAWLAKATGKVAEGSWSIGLSALTTVVTEALMRYHGFK